MQLFNGICIQNCPSPHNANNYTSYVCEVLSVPANLNVKIQSLGYINSIAMDQPTYLMADINNTNGGQIVSIAWEQLAPDLSVYPGTYVFSSDQNGLHNVNDSVVRLSNNGLMQIQQLQAVKVQCTVTNSNGDIAYDIYEFYVSASPFIGTLNFTLINADGSSTQLT